MWPPTSDRDTGRSDGPDADSDLLMPTPTCLRSATGFGAAALLVVCIMSLAGCGRLSSGSEPVVVTGRSDPETASPDSDTPASGETGTSDLLPTEPGPSDPIAITVVRVIDGDSLEVDRDGEVLEVRLAGFNAPELYRDEPDGPSRQTCQGLAARSALESLTPAGAVVDLVPSADGEDRFGRVLADLTIGSESAPSGSVVASLVAGGWGFATNDDPVHHVLMVEAAAGGAGMWGESCGRADSDQVRLGSVQADAPGNDRFNLDQEWVELVNTGTVAADLSGWVIRDDTTGHRFRLDTTVPAGATLRIVTGSGTEKENTVHLDQRFPVWSNDGETVVLTDKNGVFVDWRFLDP